MRCVNNIHSHTELINKSVTFLTEAEVWYDARECCAVAEDFILRRTLWKIKQIDVKSWLIFHKNDKQSVRQRCGKAQLSCGVKKNWFEFQSQPF